MYCFPNPLKYGTLLFAVLIASVVAHGRSYRELGDVWWIRDYDIAIEYSEADKRPIFALFQEVPGCQGCVDFGQTVLSDPLMVEAIEGSFVPLAIFNNKKGRDAEILARFDEPAWNFPVVRYLDAAGNDLLPRKERLWSTGETAVRMVEALEAADRKIPNYLHALSWNVDHEDYRTAAFSMFCFWDGEAKLGSIDGVLTTEAGWIDGLEVVKVRFDTRVLPLEDLVVKAKSFGCADFVYAPSDVGLSQENRRTFQPANYKKAKDSDQKRHLQSKVKSLERLEPGQATKINALISQNQYDEAIDWLSPFQRIEPRFEQLTQLGRTKVESE